MTTLLHAMVISVMTSSTKTPGQLTDIHLLVATLPVYLQHALAPLPLDQLIEVVMDLGRPPEARFEKETVRLADRPVTHEDISHVLALLGEFTEDNRAGIERTLHRISCIRNRKGTIIGLTLRAGRAIFGTIDLLRDLIETGQNLLVLGRPGVGKTTKLREMARVLADDFHKRVIVIDTSNEIGGDGDIPHPAIGGSRRMQVACPDRQHAVMIEAVENHMPEVIVVDEIGTEAEAAAARTIAERGVQLIGTAHGNMLENLILNPTLSDLVGGINVVTLSDEEAKRRHTSKTVTERKAPPTFDIVIEMVSRDEVVVHRNTAKAVDYLLQGKNPGGERRTRAGDGQIHTEEVTEEPVVSSPLPIISDETIIRRDKPMRIFPYALSRDLLERVIRDLEIEARVVGRAEWADIILALKTKAQEPQLKRILKEHDVPVQMVRSNSTAQMRITLRGIFHMMSGLEEETVQEAVAETEHAIRKVLDEGVEVALPPQPATVRRMQHRIISQHNLMSESVGREPHRHLVIHPG